MLNPFSHQNLTNCHSSIPFLFQGWLLAFSNQTDRVFTELLFYLKNVFGITLQNLCLSHATCFFPNKIGYVVIIWNLKTLKKKKSWEKTFIPVVVSSVTFFTLISILGNCLFCKLRKFIRFGNSTVNLNMVYEFCFPKINRISHWLLSLSVTFWHQM